MKYLFKILCGITVSMMICGATVDLNEKFFYLKEKPTDADGLVFFRGECKRNNYTPQELRIMPLKEMNVLIELEKAGRQKVQSKLIVMIKTANGAHVLEVPVRKPDSTTLSTFVGYQNSQHNFTCRAYELSKTKNSTTYAIKYAIDGEVMPAIEVTYSGEKYLPILHFNDMMIYLSDEKITFSSEEK